MSFEYRRMSSDTTDCLVFYLLQAPSSVLCNFVPSPRHIEDSDMTLVLLQLQRLVPGAQVHCTRVCTGDDRPCPSHGRGLEISTLALLPGESALRSLVRSPLHHSVGVMAWHQEKYIPLHRHHILVVNRWTTQTRLRQEH